MSPLQIESMPASCVWNFILWIHYLALSLWIGGITFLSAIAAPSAHRSMASRAIAGEIVGSMLKRFNWVEMVCCLILITTCASAFRFVAEHKQRLWILIAILVLMGLSTYFYAFSVTPQMDAI